MSEAALLTNGEFLDKLESLGRSGQATILEGFSAEDVERVVANGRTQLSNNGVALIFQCREDDVFLGETFIGFFGDYNSDTGDLTDVRAVVSDDLLAVRRSCLIIEEQTP